MTRFDPLRSAMCLIRANTFLPALTFRHAVAGHALADTFDLGTRQQWRFSDLEAAVILPRQRLALDGEPHRLVQRLADRDHAVMVEQTGEPALQRPQRVLGQLRRSEGGIGCATDTVTAGG